MIISSRPDTHFPPCDPLEEGTAFLAYAHAKFIEPAFQDAVQDSVCLKIVIKEGLVVTETSYQRTDGSHFFDQHVEFLNDVLESAATRP